MIKFLKLIVNSSPERVLDLPVGRLMLGRFEVTLSPEVVIECAEKIINRGGIEKNFHSQAGVVEYAGNDFWQNKGGYKAF